jgi:hypothetical protein
MKKILCLSLVTCSIFSMQLDLVNLDKKASKLSHYIVSKVSNKTHIKPSSVFVPDKLGEVELYHGKKGFHILKDDKKYKIQKYFTDPIVRDITKKQLNAFLKNGYFSLNQMNDGEFSLKAKGRINGGGPGLGVAAYWITKSLCYAVGLAAIGGTVVTTGGAAVGLATYGVATAGTAVVTSAAITTTAATAIGTTAGVVAGTATAGAAIAGTAGIAAGAIGVLGASGATIGGVSVATAAATTTGAVLATGASTGGIILGIEGVSVAVGTFFGMLPTP